MAIQDLKGWIWTPEEIQWITTWKRKVQRKMKHFPKQVERFRQRGLPSLAEEAARITESFLTVARELLGLADAATHCTYLTLSPEEAEDLLSAADWKIWKWRWFMGRPDVQAAIRVALRRKRDRKRAQKRTLKKQRNTTPTDGDPLITSEVADAALASLFDE